MSTRSSALERVTYTVPEFCYRNSISRPTYHRLRAEGRGPKEMRLGLNKILITADAERDWQLQMQDAAPDFEARATERAVKAGDAAVRSSKHVSKQRAGKVSRPRPQTDRSQRWVTKAQGVRQSRKPAGQG